MTRDNLLHILETEMQVESNIINKKIGRDNEMGTLQDNGRLGRLQGIHWVWRLIKQLDKAIEIPNNPTNGDMFKAVFSAKEIGIDEWYQNIGVSMNDGYKRYFSLDWWNAPYKKEDKLI